MYRFISAPGAGPRWLTASGSGSEAGERERTEDGVTHVESLIYFFIIKIRGGGVI